MKQTLTIGYNPIVDHLILGIAEHNDGGHYTNFELNTKKFFNWEPMIQSLRNKELDGMFILAPLAMEVFRNGEDIRALLLGQRDGQMLVVDNDISKPIELKNKTILVPDIFSMHHIVLYRILKDAGLEITKDIHLVAGYKDVRDIPKHLADSDIQGYVAAEPWGSLAEEMHIGHIIKVSRSLQMHHLCCVFVMRQDSMMDKSGAVQELIESLVRAGMFINAYPRQAAEIGATFMGISKKVALKSLTHHEGHVLFWDLLPRVEDFEEIQDIAVDEMCLWSDKIDVKAFLDDSFAQEAYRKWVLGVRRDTKDKGTDRTLPGDLHATHQRIEDILGEVSIVGLRYISAGEKYPKEIQRMKKMPSEYTHFLETLFEGEEAVVPSAVKEKKGFAFFTSVRDMEPDRVLMQCTPEQAKRCMRALRFGIESQKIEPYEEETAETDFITTQEPYIFLQRDDLVLCSCSYTSFRFLSLLLRYF